MDVKSIQPAFTGKLTPQQAKKLIQKNWTIPMGVDSVKLKSDSYYDAKVPNFKTKFKNFFQKLFK